MSKRDPKRRPTRKSSRPSAPPRRSPPLVPIRFGTLVRVAHLETCEPALLESLTSHFHPKPQARDAFRDGRRLALERLRELDHQAFPPYEDAIG